VDGVPWECMTVSCLHRGGWWRSIHGVVLCRNCQPPAFPALVAEEGDESNTLLVFITSGRTVFDEARHERPRSVTDALVCGLPVWILRGDHTPERVEAKDKRKKIHLPPDATHWCCEGDLLWTRIETPKEDRPDA
jgi:hypothetical protein